MCFKCTAAEIADGNIDNVTLADNVTNSFVALLTFSSDEEKANAFLARLIDLMVDTLNTIPGGSVKAEFTPEEVKDLAIAEHLTILNEMRAGKALIENLMPIARTKNHVGH